MSSRLLRNSLGLLMLPASLAIAQTVPDNAEKAENTETPAKQTSTNQPAKPQEVVITGGRGSDTDQRRQASAAKLIFGREELDRNGDNNLGEVLKRLPGVSTGGRPGRGGEIRMRGMGGGYTQILINGERAPRGFAIESLSPDQVERIEVIRGTVAEHSTQAIAGTINIVLREGYQQRDIQLKLNDSVEQGRHQPNVSITAPGKYGNLSYTLSGTLSQSNNADQRFSSKYDLDSTGALLFQENQVSDSEGRTDSIHFSPRLAWKFDNGDSLTLQSFMMHNQSQDDNVSVINVVQGNRIPAYGKSIAHAESSMTMGRLFGNWMKKLDAGARFELKFGANSFYLESDTPRTEYNPQGVLRRNLLDLVTTRERGANLSGKYSSPIGEGHLLTTGWEMEYSKRNQTRLALINNTPDPFNDGGDDNLQASSRRLAAFVQDEWDINKQWSSNFGLRWEGIRVRSGAAINGVMVDNSSSVLSPIAHAVWRVPGKERDQVRMSATHSYRTPPLGNLIATPALSQNNSATSPDRYGNPNLKPEQALGLELAFEHYLADGGILSANLFKRDIKQLMRRETSLQDGPLGPRWVSRPINIGKASTHGLELEAKFRLSQMIENAPAIDVRANYSWMWSAVDGIEGPNNRLDQQAKHSANLGLDYRIPNSGLTVGGSLNWTPAVLVQTSNEQLTGNSIKRQLDLYALLKINNYTQLRFAANNLMPRDYSTDSTLRERNVTHIENSINPSDTVWSLRLEFKL